MKNEELLRLFENAITEATKAANGWSRKSEAKLARDIERLHTEILRRMKD